MCFIPILGTINKKISPTRDVAVVMRHIGEVSGELGGLAPKR